MIYATKEDLAVWLGLTNENGDPDVDQLPQNVDKLLRNASRVIDYATMKRIDRTDLEHLETAKNATTAQCEYWIDGPGEGIDVNPAVASYQAGRVSINFTGGVNGSGIQRLSPRARRELWLGGLLNRRVRRI